jgi:hypothetical protein
MNTYLYSVNHNLAMGTHDKNLRAREQAIYLNQMEACWKVDHQPSISQQAGWIKALIMQLDEYRKPLIKALEFLVWHLSKKQAREIERFFYHGHSTIHELLMFTELNVGLKEKPVQSLLEWLMTMYHADEGCFKINGKSISQYSRRQEGMDSRVAKYRLYHLIEDDWLTYYATRIGANLME